MIVDNASGVFQWVVLVVAPVVKLKERGTPKKAIQARLQVIPKELDSLYERILREIDKDDLALSLQLMQWICFALRPLSLRELRYAMAVDVHFVSVRLLYKIIQYNRLDYSIWTVCRRALSSPTLRLRIDFLKIDFRGSDLYF